jgi:oxygen-dependent protoporphyrinogen oxidase
MDEAAAISHAIIVGAGISGLVTAWNLQRRGHRVTVLEAGSRVGGCIGSATANGLLFESGPNSLLDTSPLIGVLLREVGIEGERIEANASARNRFIVRDGRLLPVPLSPPAFLRTPLFSAGTKLGLIREPFVARAARESEETVAQFVRRRLGREFLDYAINPFVAGVYAGDPERLSVRAAFPRLFDLEQRYGSLIRGQILGARERKRNPEKSKQAAAMLSFRDGMHTLPRAIAHKLASVRTDARVTSYRRTPSGTFIVSVQDAAGPSELEAAALVLSVPADATAELVESHSPDAAAALREIVYPPVAVVVTAFRREAISHALDGFGFLVPEKENRTILGTIFSSSLFENRAPAETVLLTTFVGGMRQPELARLDDVALLRTVLSELAELIGCRGHPAVVKISRWPRAIPQYTLGHLDRVERAARVEGLQPGLFLCANWRGGISVGDCIKSAHACAERVARHLDGVLT